MAKNEAGAAKKKGAGTALVSWEAELKARSLIAKKTEDSVSLGQFFSMRAGQLAFNGSPIAGNKIDCVVLDHVLENKFYEEDFNADTPQTPSCYAFGREEKDLKPHAKVAQPQHEACKGCPQNDFGTADKGKGKACKNSRRLFLIPADALKTAQTVEDAQGGYMNLPVTSVRGWAAYVQNVANVFNRPPLGMITTISVVPDAKSQFKVTFTVKETINDRAVGAALLKRADVVASEIMFPYPEASTITPPSSRKGGAKKAAKKKARF